MKKYEVTVNGEVFEVSIRELAAGESAAVTATPAPTPTPVAQPAAPTAPASNASATPISAPMGGVIMSINVKVGQEVKVGDTIFILEAMKMENEIQATQDGVIQSIEVNESQTVESGQIIATIA